MIFSKFNREIINRSKKGHTVKRSSLGIIAFLAEKDGLGVIIIFARGIRPNYSNSKVS